jgi:hypothetical protein
MAEAFKFPDEKHEDGPGKKAETDDIKIEVVDDTPPDDKDREPMPKPIVEELDHDDLEEYSEKVKLRMKQLKKVWHDERRAKETLAREREAAVQFAELKHKENEELKKRMSAGEKIFIKEVGDAAKTQLETARASLKTAYESGDAGAIAAAAEALQDAKLRQREIEGFKPTGQIEKDVVERTSQAQPTARPDPKAEAWKAKNGWFGSDEEMTALALGLHEKLVKSGVSPASDEYYQTIDKTMKKRFPENFEEPDKPEAPARRPATVVAPATRSTAPRQVRLNTSQISIAKRLGISPEAYARELIKQENQNG